MRLGRGTPPQHWVVWMYRHVAKQEVCYQSHILGNMQRVMVGTEGY